MANPSIDWPSDDALRVLLQTKSGADIGDMLGCTADAVNKRARVRGLREQLPPETAPGASLALRGDTCEVQAATVAEVRDLMEQHGLDPDEWIEERATPNQWQALAGTDENGDPIIVALRQLKVTLRRLTPIERLCPATHVPALVKPRKVKRSSGPETIVLEGDHHAPYHDETLDAAFTALVADLQPDEHIFGGDLGDYPTISRHNDHPAAMASPQECVDASYHLLRRRREAAPNARARMLLGNHDWRIRSEMLARAERLDNLHPTDDPLPLLDLRRALQLDALGVELVENPLGWEHAEIELVPGRDGLIARHGFITGQNTALKTLNKAGRSVIYFHKHERAHVFRLDYPERVLRQASGVGAMCRNDHVHPHYVVEPDWHFGGAVVSRWPDGRFLIEHAVWQGDALYFRDRRYLP